MTADDARRMVEEARAHGSEAARVILGCWHHAIKKAAGAGRMYVRESEIDRPRMVIPAAARTAAVEQLAAAGFTVGRVETGPNESETQVTWLP